MPKGRGSNEKRRNRRLMKRKGHTGYMTRTRVITSTLSPTERVNMFNKMWNRVKAEPVLLAAVIVAGGNLAVDVSGEVESAVVVLVGAIVRAFVTPKQ